MLYDIKLSILCLLCIALGMAVGAIIATAQIHRRQRRFTAPVPVDLGYDPMNPINQRNTYRNIRVGEVDPETGFVRIS